LAKNFFAKKPLAAGTERPNPSDHPGDQPLALALPAAWPLQKFLKKIVDVSYGLGHCSGAHG
jgi:hypothetical protein